MQHPIGRWTAARHQPIRHAPGPLSLPVSPLPSLPRPVVDHVHRPSAYPLKNGLERIFGVFPLS